MQGACWGFQETSLSHAMGDLAFGSMQAISRGCGLEVSSLFQTGQLNG